MLKQKAFSFMMLIFLMYNRLHFPELNGSLFQKTKKLRQKNFLTNMKTIPTTQAILYQHTKRVYQHTKKELIQATIWFLITLVGERIETVGSPFSHCFLKLQQIMSELLSFHVLLFVNVVLNVNVE